MAEQRPQPPEIRDSRRKFLVRSAKIGAAGLPLMATLHHRSALAEVCWGGRSTAGSMDLSGRHELNESCINQGFSLTLYTDPSYWPSIVKNAKDPTTITVSELLGTGLLIGAGASGFSYGTENVISSILVSYPNSAEALAIQTLLNAYNGEEGVFDFAISSEFAKELIQTLFAQGDTNHSFHLPPADNVSNSILAFFAAIND